MTRARIPACAALALCLAACRSAEPPPARAWSFDLSRRFYGNFFGGVSEAPSTADTLPPCVAVALLAAPLAIDLAALPVTGVHDLYVRYRPAHAFPDW